VKTLTGGEMIKTRQLYQACVEIKVQFKIWMAVNHLPCITGRDRGVWRRIKVIPFKHTIPDDKRDLWLHEKLLAESSGIFNWLLDGYHAWRLEGLGTAPAVEQAIQDYRAESFPCARFLDECVTPSADVWAKSSDLYEAYQSWCASNEYEPVSQRDLALSLKEGGISFRKRNDGNYYGVQLALEPA